MNLALGIAIAFIWGAVPWSWIIAKLSKGVELREEGSKNVGATNVLRTCGRLPGALAYLADGAKGFTAVWFIPRLLPVDFLSGELFILHGAALMLAVMLGHIFTPFLGFRGGKGAMAGLAATVALDPWVGLATLGVFLVVLLFTRIVSISTLSAAGAYPIIIAVFAMIEDVEPNYYFLGFAAVVATLVVVMHRDNIRRLIRGVEAPPRPGGTPGNADADGAGSADGPKP